MKILVDETRDGWDIELQKLGYDAYSVKLRWFFIIPNAFFKSK